MEKGGADVPSLKSKPKLRAELLGYYEGFLAISAQREVNPAGVQALQFSEIESYCRIFGVPPGDSRRKFTRLILNLDYAYLAQAAKQVEAARKKNR